MIVRNSLFACAAALVAVLPSAASAHPKLVATTPAADASVAAPAKIDLKFSEKLLPPLSGATLTMTGMPGMANHPAMLMPGVRSSVGADGTTLSLVSSRPLVAATYRVDWHVVSADTHRIAGAYSFTVR